MAGVGRPGPGPRGALPAWKREILERKRAKLAALGAGAAAGPAGPAAERLVVAESLGPLRDNPFMRLESERRRGAGAAGPAAAGARPVQQLLELYRRVPAVRTIRADNILIIEAAPGFAPAAEPGPAARIRAAEVLVYEAPPPPGRVSRLLQKFDAPGAPHRRGSPERGRPVPASPRAARPEPEPEPEPARRRAPSPGPGPRRGDFLLKTGSNSFTVHPRGLHRAAGARPLPNGPAVPEPPASAANGVGGSAPEPGVWKPKVGPGSPPAHRTPSAMPASPACPLASATPSQRQRVSGATSANDSFEIRPACKPDLRAIPEGDLQARALASLRAHSRNSFVLIPKRKASGALSPAPEARAPGAPATAAGGWGAQSPERKGPLELGGAGGAPSPLGREELGRLLPATALVDQGVPRQPPPSPSPSPGATAEAQGFRIPEWSENGGEPGLPVTFIDEVDSEDEALGDAKPPFTGAAAFPQYRPHPSGTGHRGGSTFLVVPKRKPGTVQAGGEPGAPEAEGEEAHTGPGVALRPRYPTVHEIEVVGGYLSLQRSCLAKAGSSRKKMKISFNDKSLQTTFEYPSESSLAQEAAEEEEEEDDDEEEEEEEEPFKFFLPRATFVGSRAAESPVLPDGGSCLASYTPKHSVAFSKWQEQALELAPRQAEAPLKEVMLTPASQNDLSDFRSEPALYF